MLRYANSEKTMIDMEVDGQPFTASANDPEAHGRELFERAQAGEYGEVADYVAPPIPEPEPVEADPNAELKARVMHLIDNDEAFREALSGGTA